MPMKPTPMPMKTGKPMKPVMPKKTGMAYGGMTKAKGMAYGGMTEKPMGMGMAKGGMAKKAPAKKGKK